MGWKKKKKKKKKKKLGVSEEDKKEIKEIKFGMNNKVDLVIVKYCPSLSLAALILPGVKLKGKGCGTTPPRLYILNSSLYSSYKANECE